MNGRSFQFDFHLFWKQVSHFMLWEANAIDFLFALCFNDLQFLVLHRRFMRISLKKVNANIL